MILSRRLWVTLQTLLVAALAVAAAANLHQYAAKTVSTTPRPTGILTLYVEDGPTAQPLPGVTIVIPEAGLVVVTDEMGETPALTLPVIADGEFSNILPKPWGEITLLVYRAGYIEQAIFHVNVWENQVRNGPSILLFPQTPGAVEPHILTEGPQKPWVQELLSHYRPAEGN